MSRTYRNHADRYMWIKEKRRGRDTKAGNKPDKAHKTVYKHIRRAKEKQAFRRGKYDIMPLFRKTDEWNYT